MRKRELNKRPKTPREAKIAAALMQLVDKQEFGFEVALALDDASWRSCVHGVESANFVGMLEPVMRRALHRYGLARSPYVEDGTQRLAVKLFEAKCFKNYRALDTTPKAYLFGCAPMYAMTIARSIWRDYRRNNGLDNGGASSGVRRPRPKPSPSLAGAAVAGEDGSCAQEEEVLGWG